MEDDEGITNIIKNAAKGDEKRASFVYLMEKYRPQRHYFKTEEEKLAADGFCVRFRLSEAYKDLEKQEIQASIPNLKPRRRRKLRIQRNSGLERLGSITESNMGEDGGPTSNTQSPDGKDSPGIPDARLSGMEKFKKAIRKASVARLLTKVTNSEENKETDQKENLTSSRSFVRFRRGSKEALPRPQMSENPPRKGLLRNNSSVSNESAFGMNTGRKNSQQSVDFKRQDSMGKDSMNTPSERSTKSCMKDSKSTKNTEDKGKERRRSVRLFEVPCRTRHRGSIPEPVQSKFFNAIMERKFSTAGIGFTYNTLLDNGTRSDFDRSTVAGSVSGFNTLSDTFITGSETVMDYNTCAGSMYGSCYTSIRGKHGHRAESPERSKTSHSKRRGDDEEFQKGSVNNNSKSRSQSAKLPMRKIPKPTLQSTTTPEPGGKKLKPAVEKDDTKPGKTKEDDDDEEEVGGEKKLRLRPAKYLYHMCNCTSVARPGTLNKLAKASRRKVAGIIEIYGCHGDSEEFQGSVYTGFRSPSQMSATSTGSGDKNVVCPFCTIFPKEKVNAWIEDMTDCVDKPWNSVG